MYVIDSVINDHEHKTMKAMWIVRLKCPAVLVSCLWRISASSEWVSRIQCLLVFPVHGADGSSSRPQIHGYSIDYPLWRKEKHESWISIGNNGRFGNFYKKNCLQKLNWKLNWDELKILHQIRLKIQRFRKDLTILVENGEDNVNDMIREFDVCHSLGNML